MAEDILSVTDKNFEEEVLKNDLPVLVDFWAVWCAPCRAIVPTLEHLSQNYKDKIKIIISGSESLFIKARGKDTLSGRMFQFKINRLNFREYLSFCGVEYRPLDLYRVELKGMFHSFMINQGFPELVGIDDRDIIAKYINESIIDRIIYKDLPTIYNIRDISSLCQTKLK